MKQNHRQLDTFGIPKWIGNFCNHHQTLLLSDTRTYRLLMTIYRLIIERTVPATASDTDREEMLLGFMTWFLALGNSMPAWPGLMWVHQGIGKKILDANCGGQIADDERLSRILMAFIVLSDKNAEDPFCERYHGMVGEGWNNIDQDEHKESLYRGFVASLLAHSYHELKSVGEERGFSESELKNSLQSASEYFARQDQ